MMKSVWEILKASVRRTVELDIGRHAAALSFHALFSLAPILIIILGLTGRFFGPGEVRRQLLEAIDTQMGPQVTGMIESLITSTATGSYQSATIIGLAILAFAATGFLTQLQKSLNTIWKVPGPRYSGLLQQLLMRVLSLGMVLVLSLLVLVAVTAQTVFGIIRRSLTEQIPQAEWLFVVANQLLAIAVLAVTFTALVKILTHTRVRWKSLLTGAALTAVMLQTGLVLVGVYLTTSAVSSAFGAAGSLVALLLFIFYSLLISLFGVVFTVAHQEQLAATASDSVSD